MFHVGHIGFTKVFSFYFLLGHMAFPPSVMRTSRCNGVQQYLGTIIHERYSHRPISIRDLGNATTRYREHVAQHFTIGVWLGGYVTLTFQNYLTETSLLS